jgi:hypothetical protein
MGPVGNPELFRPVQVKYNNALNSQPPLDLSKTKSLHYSFRNEGRARFVVQILWIGKGYGIHGIWLLERKLDSFMVHLKYNENENQNA